jgi:hypothetical protein
VFRLLLPRKADRLLRENAGTRSLKSRIGNRTKEKQELKISPIWRVPIREVGDNILKAKAWFPTRTIQSPTVSAVPNDSSYRPCLEIMDAPWGNTGTYRGEGSREHSSQRILKTKTHRVWGRGFVLAAKLRRRVWEAGQHDVAQYLFATRWAGRGFSSGILMLTCPQPLVNVMISSRTEQIWSPIPLKPQNRSVESR